MPPSLVILGCSQRKKLTPQPIPAIDRYDGPVFRVLRKHARDTPGIHPDTYVLSGRFGLIPGESLIPLYDHRLSHTDHVELRTQVAEQLKKALDELQPERLFVSVGRQYWPLLEDPLSREVVPERLVVASGSIGGRASQLVSWLRFGEVDKGDIASDCAPGEATLLGTTVRLNREQVLCEARKALLAAPVCSRRFETWYVAVGSNRVAPKWLVSVLFDKPVALFRTADAKRVLSLLGVDCIYANRD